MTTVKIFTPQNRLAKVVGDLNGGGFDELLEASEGRVKLLGGAIRAYVTAEVAAITEIHRQGEEILFGLSREVAHSAMNIAEVAAAAGLPALGEVARSVRAMIDSLISHGVWHTDALELHITSLSLLNREVPPPAPEVEQMLRRLSEMRAAIGVVE